MAAGATEIGGALPVNTDGGCTASGEPIGASGLRQVHETVLQLRGQAGTARCPGPGPASPTSTARPGSARAPCSAGSHRPPDSGFRCTARDRAR
jgi:acetyl-CoA acetyltransferase